MMTRRAKRDASKERTSPDQGLVEAQYPELNHRFYQANPAAYFKRRLHLLLVAAGASDKIQELLSEGVRYEGIISVFEPSEDPSADEKERQSFLATDAEVLLHHASEALLRLYFAHVAHPSCPWLKCAHLRNFTEFKQKMADFRRLPSHLFSRDVAELFIGSVPDEENTEATEAVETIGRLLKTLANRLLDDSSLYNSAKHGLAVIADESSITITHEQSGTAFIGSNGQSLAFLETRDVSPNEPKWHVTTRWVSIKQAMWLTMMAVTEMASSGRSPNTATPVRVSTALRSSRRNHSKMYCLAILLTGSQLRVLVSSSHTRHPESDRSVGAITRRPIECASRR